MSLQQSSRMMLRRAILRPTAIISARSAPSSSQSHLQHLKLTPRRTTNSLNRPVSTQTISSSENLELLNKQRALRPNSPWHIYQPQLTSMSSIANRVTGVGLTAAFYAVFLSHLTGLDSATMVSFMSELPQWFKLTTKAAIGWAMSYHTINGMRHLAWDTGKLLELKTSYAAGYAVIAASGLATVGLLMI